MFEVGKEIMKKREFDKKGFKFSSTPNSATMDRAILKRWELCELSSYGAMLRMKKNNGWNDELTIHGFEELANSLGYWQPGKLPQWARIWDDQQFEI